jgi:hypothetical protein
MVFIPGEYMPLICFYQTSVQLNKHLLSFLEVICISNNFDALLPGLFQPATADAIKPITAPGGSLPRSGGGGWFHIYRLSP